MVSTKAFSLLELIFAIVIIGIISTVAVPKLLDTKDNAEAAIVQKDIATIISSVRAYYMVNNKLDDFKEALTLNPNTWNIEGTTAIYKDDNSSCVSVNIENKKLSVIINDENSGSVCEKIIASGISSSEYDL
ncbi:prepilin-type N-terminal cleavage/methylation domain-containing protein [Arcobacter sp. KX21116]|jgi:general secretion pathway protein G|uniref:prepilin-type N-terminal cleavage/methylation domain-containing protein n=1 Tax=Arcobacter TaxID=28196 RepID=UPI0035D46F48